MERRTYGIQEVAQMLGISNSLAYSLARKGELPGVRRIGEKRLVVLKEVFDGYLQKEEAV